MTPIERQIRGTLPSRWYVPVSFPIEELGEHLSDDEYRHYEKVCPEINIVIHFDYSPADPSVGIMGDSVEWNGDWSLPMVGNYPEKVKAAISAYLDSIDVDMRWAKLAEDSVDSYVEHLLYPDL